MRSETNNARDRESQKEGEWVREGERESKIHSSLRPFWLGTKMRRGNFNRRPANSSWWQLLHSAKGKWIARQTASQGGRATSRARRGSNGESAGYARERQPSKGVVARMGNKAFTFNGVAHCCMLWRACRAKGGLSLLVRIVRSANKMVDKPTNPQKPVVDLAVWQGNCIKWTSPQTQASTQGVAQQKVNQSLSLSRETLEFDFGLLI